MAKNKTIIWEKQMNNTPDYEDLAFSPKDTNYDILKEYEAHGEPLPRYDIYKSMENHCAVYSDANNYLVEENKKLRDLLEECKKWMSIERDFAMPNEKIILQMTLDKIDEALK